MAELAKEVELEENFHLPLSPSSPPACLSFPIITRPPSIVMACRPFPVVCGEEEEKEDIYEGILFSL